MARKEAKQLTLCEIVKLRRNQAVTLPGTFVSVLSNEIPTEHTLMIFIPSTNILRFFPSEKGHIIRLDIYVKPEMDETGEKEFRDIFDTFTITPIYETHTCAEQSEYPDIPVGQCGRICIYHRFIEPPSGQMLFQSFLAQIDRIAERIELHHLKTGS